jgi:hypothetical protein
MPIFSNETSKLLYVHTPKTGGTYIESLFKQSGYSISLLQRPGDPLIGLRKCSPQHFHAEILQCIFRIDRFDSVFMTVRHPVARILSEYRMRTPDVVTRSAAEFQKFVERCFDLYGSDKFCYDNHIRPQVDFYLDSAIVTKQEDGYDSHWANHLSVMSKLPISLHNKSSQPANATSKEDKIKPDHKTIAMIVSFYKDDFRFFGYDFNF